MRRLCLWLVLFTVGANAWGGYIDTDGYYILDGYQFSAFDGQTNGSLAMDVNPPHVSLSGVSTNAWWAQIWANGSVGRLPTDLSGATGWKLTWTNTSPISISLTLIVGTAANGWQSGTGVSLNPDQTGTSYINITGPEVMTHFTIVIATGNAAYDVITYDVPGIQNYLLPYDPDTSDQVYNESDTTKADVILRWKAAKDPNGLSTNLVNQDIVDQYVFMSTPTDPNLFYVGATGDPLDNPDSAFSSLLLPLETTLKWAVVDVLSGFTQELTGESTLDDVDPNNLIGPEWSFTTLSSTPIINTQPVSKRFGVSDVNAQFTIDVISATLVRYQWYLSTTGVIADGNEVAIGSGFGGNTDTLTITSHTKGYQAYYYCKVGNDATISGGGPKDDVYSDIVSLVVERKVAEYLFDGNFNDTSGGGYDGTGVGSPTCTTTGVGGVGQALSLDGATQYVQIGSFDVTDPNIFMNNCFPRADLLAEGGIGGGLDVGTVMCWIKLNATDANEVSAILSNQNDGWPATWFQFGMAMDSAAANTSMRTFLWGDDSMSFWSDTKPVWADPYDIGGDDQWHMLAATWNINTGGTVKKYLDGNLIAQGGSAATTEFSAWDNPMEIGFDGGTNYFGGLIDNLRVYNYEVAAEDIVAEAYAITGKPGCLDHGFVGSNMNVNQLGSSYCKIDLADFAALAANWLNDGYYTPAP